MSNNNKPAPVKPREFWILCEEQSNRALTRAYGENWPDDIKGEPSNGWLQVIEKSAYTALQAEVELVKSQESYAVKRLNEANEYIERLKAQLATMTSYHDSLAAYQDQRRSWLNEALEREAELKQDCRESHDDYLEIHDLYYKALEREAALVEALEKVTPFLDNFDCRWPYKTALAALEANAKAKAGGK